MSGIDRERRLGPRAAKSQATRRRIVAAASRLFVEQGYVPTTMEAIAQEAGVAVQTLYLACGSKAKLLSAALDVAIVGDDAPAPLIERPWVAQFRATEDGPQALALLCREVGVLFTRVAPLHQAIRAATGDAEVADLLARDQQSRYETQRQWVAMLASKPGFTADLGLDRAADRVYGLLSEAGFLLFCHDRGWSVEEWTTWVCTTLTQQFFPAAAQARQAAPSAG